MAGDNFRAIRPTYNHKLNWTAGHSTFELSLSDADTSPCEVLASAWEQADEQKWKIVPANYQPPALAKNAVERQRLFSVRVRRRDSRFGLSLEEGRLVLRLVLPGSPEQSWKVLLASFYLIFFMVRLLSGSHKMEVLYCLMVLCEVLHVTVLHLMYTQLPCNVINVFWTSDSQFTTG